MGGEPMMNRTLTNTGRLMVLMAFVAGCSTGASTTLLDLSTDAVDDLSDMADSTHPDITDTTPPDTALPDAADTMPSDTDDTSPPGNGVGEPCSVTADCYNVPGAGRLCLSDLLGYLTFNGGYCSAACTSAADCGAGGSCVDVYGYNYCLKLCTSAVECRTSEGYSCTTLPGSIATTYCLPPTPDPETATDY